MGGRGERRHLSLRFRDLCNSGMGAFLSTSMAMQKKGWAADCFLQERRRGAMKRFGRNLARATNRGHGVFFFQDGGWEGIFPSNKLCIYYTPRYPRPL